MKSPRLFGIVFLALCTTAQADLTVVQKMAGADGVHEITLKVKGDKARVDVTPQVTTIIDAKTGDLTTLLNDKKTVLRISGERAKAMAEVAKSFVKEEAPEQALPKPTGQKETISGYETEEYVSDSPKYHATYWVAKSYPNYENILQQMSLLQRGAFASITKGMAMVVFNEDRTVESRQLLDRFVNTETFHIVREVGSATALASEIRAGHVAR